MEPYISQRLEKAEEYARKLLNGEVVDEKALLDILRWRICTYYSIPFFDKYFQDRTLDELAFEASLIKYSTETRQDVTKRTSNLLNQATQEDLDELSKGWEDVDAASSISEEQFLEDAKKFMKTNEFITPKEAQK